MKIVKSWDIQHEVFSTCSCPLDGNNAGQCGTNKDNAGFTVIKGKFGGEELFGLYFKHGGSSGMGFPKSFQSIAPLVVPEFVLDNFFKKWNER